MLVVDDVLSNRSFLARLLRTRLHAIDRAAAALEGQQQQQQEAGGGDGAASSSSSSASSSSLVDEVMDGAEALQAVKNKGLTYYDAVCMDGDMPVMDGYAATRGLREMGYKGLILGCTGNALPADQQRFIDEGAEGVLCKPIDPNVVIGRLREFKRVM